MGQQGEERGREMELARGGRKGKEF